MAFNEILRVSNAENIEIFCLADDDGNVYVIDDDKKQIISYIQSWAYSPDDLFEYINDCDEILELDKYMIDDLTTDDGEQLEGLTPKGMARLLEYLKR